MAYALRSKIDDDLIIADSRLGEIKTPIGSLLFSFLDLDFTQYDSLYKLIDGSSDIEYEDVEKLFEKYPKTGANYKKRRRGLVKEKEIEDFEFDTYLRGVVNFFISNNVDAFQDIYEHPYVAYSGSMYKLNFYEPDSIIPDMDFIKTQTIAKELIDFCLLDTSIPEINQLTAKERYYLFLTLKRESWLYEISTHQTVFTAPSTLSNEISEIYYKNTGNEDFEVSLISKDIITKVMGSSRIFNVNTCETVRDFALFELNILLMDSKQIKKCVNCNRLFVTNGKYNTDCCDRIPAGEKYSCKKIMAMKKRKEKVSHNPIVKEYEKAYKRYYARVSNNKMSRDEFRLWVDESTLKRDDATRQYESNPSDQIIDDFKKYLGNK